MIHETNFFYILVIMFKSNVYNAVIFQMFAWPDKIDWTFKKAFPTSL